MITKDNGVADAPIAVPPQHPRLDANQPESAFFQPSQPFVSIAKEPPAFFHLPDRMHSLPESHCRRRGAGVGTSRFQNHQEKYKCRCL
jgi:hypothetical protein